jgi:hypothetical protein
MEEITQSTLALGVDKAVRHLEEGQRRINEVFGLLRHLADEIARARILRGH